MLEVYSLSGMNVIRMALFSNKIITVTDLWQNLLQYSLLAIIEATTDCIFSLLSMWEAKKKLECSHWWIKKQKMYGTLEKKGKEHLGKLQKYLFAIGQMMLLQG